MTSLTARIQLRLTGRLLSGGILFAMADTSPSTPTVSPNGDVVLMDKIQRMVQFRKSGNL